MEYPEHMTGHDPFGLKERLRRTYDRIGAQVDANVAEEKERIAALAWSRANGNLHKEGNQRHPDTQALVEALGEALEVMRMTAQRGIADPYVVTDLRALCELHGYGNIMASASELWRNRLEREGLSGGEFCSGPCRSTAEKVVAMLEAALSTFTGDTK